MRKNHLMVVNPEKNLSYTYKKQLFVVLLLIVNSSTF